MALFRKRTEKHRLARVVVSWGLLALTSCVDDYGRTTIPRGQARYAKAVTHELNRALAFARVGQALDDSYDDLPKVLKLREPTTFTWALEPTVSYRTGGPMGPTRHAKYTLQIVVGERAIDFAFELGPEVETGTFAPEAAIPYIRYDFDAVVTGVEKAVRAP